LGVGLQVVSHVPGGEDVVIPLSWPKTVKNVKLTYSIMMPGTVLDEGERRIDGRHYKLVVRPEQLSIQYPFIDTVDYASGRKIMADTIVVVVFLEGEKDGEKVYDTTRLILRGRTLFNARAMDRGKEPGPDGPEKNLHPF